MEIDPRFKVFHGVHFVLFGFNHIDESRVRTKLIDGGGVDVVQYGPSCTHVIVDKLLYDDPVCVAARNDGKVLVTGLWVDHNFDTGLEVDATSVIYRPLRELNGIPGAKRLIMCLTGYQRQDRDDVMTMVGLMGAQFSKPLVAHKVTHLICYKFEGEKYDLAKKLKTIKLVNHRWLEDCLSEWTLLPESNYNLSGYDMDMLEAEAKDSEDEINSNTIHLGVRNFKSPNTLKFGLHSTSEISDMLPVSKTSNDSRIIVDSKNISTAPTHNSELIQPGKLDKHDTIGAPTCREANNFNDAQCSVPYDMNIRNSESEKQKVKNDLMSTPLNAARSPQLCATSYSRRALSKASLPLHSGGRLDNANVSPKIAKGEMNNNIGLDESSASVKRVNVVPTSVYEQNLWRGYDLVGTRDSNGPAFVGTGDLNGRSPLKRTPDVSNDVSKSHTMNEDTKSSTVNSLSGNEKILGLEIKRSLDNNDSSECRARNSQHRASNTEISSSMKKPLVCDLPIGKSVFPSTEDVGDDSKHTHQTSSEKGTSPDKHDLLNYGYGSAGDVVGKTKQTDKQQQVVLAASESDKGTEAKILACATNSNPIVENVDSHTKQHRIKMLAKKSLGSRRKLSANQKGSIFSNKAISSNDSIFSTHGTEKCFSSMLEISPKTVSTGVQKIVEKTDLVENAVNFLNYEPMDEDDETEAPENKEADFEQVRYEEKSDVVQSMSDVDKLPKETASEMPSNNINTSVLDETVPSCIIKRVTEPGEPVSNKNVQLDESRVGDVETSKMNVADRLSMEKTSSNSSMKSEQIKDGKASRKKIQGTKKKKAQPLASGPKTKVHTPHDKSEKENKPFINGDQTIDKHCVEKSTVKCNAKERKTNKTTEISADSSMVIDEVLREVKGEPVCFILSGHRLQRKEFQQVIRRLKGRFCRDSHQWSYQATHFIAPEPIRRTEKFFAAAAAGRWILKPDYLTDCSQAGKLLKEEPYEWYKNGLTEDGAINLEAPRKWRLLRERTRHGALFGMRIIIYGECIAPSLDTLKRAVKSGDGTILATSPPYTRFLDSGVDFAVVSPGMPRADLWVQEFLNNEIPCVAADYLVEYVCKPGYPLEKHVLYNTHEWAERSFNNLKRKAEEVAEDLSPPDDCSDNDIACQECGSKDRGEVMLICGSEDGSNGCGVGMHIDCCNPPFMDIPDGDWFCPECISSRNKNSPNKRKKGVSVKK